MARERLSNMAYEYIAGGAGTRLRYGLIVRCGTTSGYALGCWSTFRGWNTRVRLFGRELHKFPTTG